MIELVSIKHAVVTVDVGQQSWSRRRMAFIANGSSRPKTLWKGLLHLLLRTGLINYLCLTTRSITSFFEHLTGFVFALLRLLHRPSDSGMAATDMMPDDATTGSGRDPWDVQPTPRGSVRTVKFLVCEVS